MLQDWNTTGGVLMIGYELYRLLSMKKDKKPRKKRKDAKSEVDKEKEKEKEKEEKKPDVNEDTQVHTSILQFVDFFFLKSRLLEERVFSKF